MIEKIEFHSTPFSSSNFIYNNEIIHIDCRCKTCKFSKSKKQMVTVQSRLPSGPMVLSEIVSLSV